MERVKKPTLKLAQRGTREHLANELAPLAITA